MSVSAGVEDFAYLHFSSYAGRAVGAPVRERKLSRVGNCDSPEERVDWTCKMGALYTVSGSWPSSPTGVSFFFLNSRSATSFLRKCSCAPHPSRKCPDSPGRIRLTWRTPYE